jgi:hypothetical protein
MFLVLLTNSPKVICLSFHLSLCRIILHIAAKGLAICIRHWRMVSVGVVVLMMVVMLVVLLVMLVVMLLVHVGVHVGIHLLWNDETLYPAMNLTTELFAVFCLLTK